MGLGKKGHSHNLHQCFLHLPGPQKTQKGHVMPRRSLCLSSARSGASTMMMMMRTISEPLMSHFALMSHLLILGFIFFKQQCFSLLIEDVTGIRMCTQKVVLDQHVHIGQAGKVPC